MKTTTQDLQALLIVRAHLDSLVKEGRITKAQRKATLLSLRRRLKDAA